jgi:DNA repair photolyase
MKVIQVHAKRIFTKTKLPGCDWVINQYVGCQHACKYCYAKFVCKWKGHGEWGSWVEVKVNAPDLVKESRPKGYVYMSSVSDPYQPIEKRLELTRRVLENMNKGVRLAILSKSKLLLRDLDLFKRFETIEVGLTINGFEGRLKREIEPHSSSHEERVDALKRLKEEGIRNYAFVSPAIPGLVDVGSLIERTKSFVDTYWIEVLNLRGAGRGFVEWLSVRFPRSYEVLTKSWERRRFIQGIADVAKKAGVRVEGIVVHQPKFELLRI